MARHRRIEAQLECLNSDPPATTSGIVVEAIRAACGELGLQSLAMISRAYHDSLFMTRIAPTGMIFIPCKEGISHRPEEYSDPGAIARGIEVLAMTLARLTGAADQAQGAGAGTR